MNDEEEKWFKHLKMCSFGRGYPSTRQIGDNFWKIMGIIVLKKDSLNALWLHCASASTAIHCVMYRECKKYRNWYKKHRLEYLNSQVSLEDFIK